MRFLFGAVTLMLLLVCANVASLLLARGSRRAGEFALRTAIGAGRGAIIRQVLVESVILSLCGGAVGVALAYELVHTVLRLLPLDIPRMEGAGVDGRRETTPPCWGKHCGLLCLSDTLVRGDLSSLASVDHQEVLLPLTAPSIETFTAIFNAFTESFQPA